jgi:putative ABC transport system permease protein
VEAGTWAGAVAIAAALALAVGLPPAWRARRLRIVDALAGHR